MNKYGKYFTWMILLLASLVLTSSSLFAHVQTKPSQTVLKAATKTNLELLAEIEEDENENRGQEQFLTLPLLHFLYAIEFHLADFHVKIKTGESPQSCPTIPIHCYLCVFRI